MKRILELAVIGGALVSVFFLYYPAHAATNWQTFATSSITRYNTDNTKYFPQQINFTNTGCLDSFTELTKSPYYSNTGIISTNTINPNPAGIWHGFITSTGPVIGGNATIYTTYFRSSTAGDIPICYTANSDNRFVVPNNTYFYTSNDSSTYTNADNWDKLGYSLDTYHLGDPPQPYDLWVSFNGFSTSTGYEKTNIWFENTPTSTCDFMAWPVDHNSLNQAWADYPSPRIIVKWGLWDDTKSLQNMLSWTDTNGCSPTDEESKSNTSYIDFFNTMATGSLKWCDHWGILKDRALSQFGEYIAQAYLVKNGNQADLDLNNADPNKFLNDTNNIAVSTTYWVFGMFGTADDPVCSAYTMYPSNTWPITTTTINTGLTNNPYAADWCAGYSSGTAWWDLKSDSLWALCNLAQWLLKPNSNDVATWNTLKTNLSTKWPFGYAGSFITAINTTTVSSSFNASIYTQYSFWSSIQTYLSILIYCLTGFWIFNRARHFF